MCREVERPEVLLSDPRPGDDRNGGRGTGRDSPGPLERRLWEAIRHSGLSYREVARRAQSRLPDGMRISDISVWACATGHRRPHRLEHVVAIAQALDLSLFALTSVSRPADRTRIVEDLGDGRARLRLDVDVTLPVATVLAIIELLEGEQEGEIDRS